MNEYNVTYDGKRSIYRVWKYNEYGGRSNWSLASCVQYIEKMTKQIDELEV